MSEPPKQRAAIAFILVTITLDVLAMGIIIPVLPKLVEDFMAGDTVRASEAFGLFGTVWAIMQLFCSPILGALSDRFGRRPVLLASMAGLGADYILMALAPTLSWLLLGRVLSGMTAASFSTANAYISDITPPERRASAFGLVGAAFGLGFVLGPAVGGLLGGFDPRLPFWVAAAFCLANATYGLLVLPESLPVERRVPFSLARANPLGSLRLFSRSRALLGLVSAHLLYSLGHSVYPAVFVLYAGYRYGWEEQMVGLVLALVGVSGMIVQGLLTGRVVRLLGDRGAWRVGLAFSAAGFLLYGLAPTGPWLCVCVPIAALGGFYGPAAQGLMTRHVSPTEQGQLQGGLSSLLGVGSLLAPTLYTQTFARAIDGSAGLLLPGAPFLLASLLVLLALAAGWRSSGEIGAAAMPAGERS